MKRAFAGAALLLALATPAVAAEPTPSPSVQAPEAPLKVVVTQLLPRAPKAHDAFEITGHLTNIGTAPITRVTVRLRVGEVISYRGDLHDADSERPRTFAIARTVTLPVSTSLLPGASTAFDLRTDLDRLKLSTDGVYPLDLETRGDVGDGIQSLGLAPTWLPYFSSGTPKPLRVGVVWPLVDKPRQDPGGTFQDDALASSLQPAGRLGGLLTAGRDAAVPDCGRGANGPGTLRSATPLRCDAVGVTWAIDPDLLAAAGTMTKPYRVVDGRKTSAGTGQAAAIGWLTSLRQAVAGGELLALPYADPDVTPLTRTPSGSDDLARATALGRSTVTQLLGTSPIDTVAWPPAGPVGKPAFNALALSGARSFVLDASAYGLPDAEANSTPNARTELATSDTGDPLTGLVDDDFLSHLVTGPDARDLGPRLAEQRFLAETAVLASERPGTDSRTMIIAPDRRTTLNAAAATGALRDLGRVPWLCSVSLASLATSTEQCPGSVSPAAAPQTRGQARTDTSGMLTSDHLAGIARDRRDVTQLTDSVLSDSQDPAIRTAVAALKLQLRQGIARAESSAWRGNPGAARTSARQLDDAVTALTSKVVVRGGRALLTSSKGTLQVSVENTLRVPIDVRVTFSSGTATLPVGGTGLLEVPAGHAVPATYKAQSQRSGQYVVFAQIIDREGNPFGKPAEVIVRSTQFGRLALAVTLGGIAVLFVTAGVRIVRRAVRGTPVTEAPAGTDP
jgi:hypothetical protein